MTSQVTQVEEDRSQIQQALALSVFWNLGGRIVSYGKNLLIAFFLGYTMGTDAFFMAMALLGFSLIFADVFDSCGIPAMVQARRQGEEQYRELLATLFTFTLALAVVLSLLNLLFAPYLAQLAFGMAPQGQRVVAHLIRLLAPYTFCYFLLHHFCAIFRAERHFQVFYFSNFLHTSVVGIAMLVFLFVLHRRDVLILAYSNIFGMLVTTATVVVWGRKHLIFGWKWSQQTRVLLREYGYLSALYGVGALNMIVDRSYTSLLPVTYITSLYFGTLVVYAFRNIVNFENIFITPLSESNVASQMLGQYLRLLVCATLPIALFLMCNSVEITEAIYGYGLVKPENISSTAQAMSYFALTLPLSVLWATIYRAMQVLKQLKKLFWIAWGAVLLNGLANHIGVVVLSLGLAGVAAGTILSLVLIVSLGLWQLRKLGKLSFRQLGNIPYGLFLVLLVYIGSTYFWHLPNPYGDLLVKGIFAGLLYGEYLRREMSVWHH